MIIIPLNLLLEGFKSFVVINIHPVSPKKVFLTLTLIDILLIILGEKPFKN